MSNKNFATTVANLKQQLAKAASIIPAPTVQVPLRCRVLQTSGAPGNRNMPQLEVHYEPSSILLTLGISFIGSFAAISLCEQYRLATLSSAQSKRYFVLFLVAISLSWSNSWSVFCCSVASVKLKLNGIDVPIRFDRGLIILAAFQNVVQTYMGLLIGASDPCFNNTRKEIMEKFVARASNTYTLQQIRKMNKLHMLFIVCTHSLESINIGGSLGGIGLAISHFIVMFSMQFQGKIRYRPVIVVAIFVICTMNSTGGFWMFFRFLSIFPSLDFMRIIAPLLALVTVCGIQYIGMFGNTFEYDINGSPPDEAGTIGQGELYSMAVTSCVIFVIIMLMFTLFDLRSWLLCTSTQLRQADKALNALMKRTQNQQQQQAPPTGASTAVASSSRTNVPHRTPSDALKYSRRFLSSNNILNTDSASSKKSSSVTTTAAGTPATASSKGVHVHSMYTDYEDEDENGSSEDELSASMSMAERSGGSPAGGKSYRKVSILRSDSFSNAGHNLADLENQQPASSTKPKPQHATIAVDAIGATAVSATSSSGSAAATVAGSSASLLTSAEQGSHLTIEDMH